MGVGVKTLSRIQKLHESGYLKTGHSIVELGAQQVMCRGKDNYIRDFIRHFSDKPYQQSDISRLATNGLMGDLMEACGFKYCALDIFDAAKTILFDLNLHDVPNELMHQFDLVTNFGTTEHVIHQYRAMKAIHDLTKVGGLIYHDLPMGGYHCHGYFSYTPLFFFHLATANGYKIIMQNYIKNHYPTDTPIFMRDNGYSDKHYYDSGIEFIFQKTSDAPFRMPLETSTSLGLNESVWGDENPYAKPAALGLEQIASGGTVTPSLLETASGWELQRELVRRYKNKLLRLFRAGA